MSNWFFVGLAYGVTYFVLVGFAVYLVRRRAHAKDALDVEMHRPED